MFKPQTIISAGNFQVSIGRTTGHVAIVSKSSGAVCKLKDIRKGGKLSKIKRAFKANLSSDDAFFFEYMTEDQTTKLLKMLKSK